MFKIPLAEIKEKIIASGKLTSNDLDLKIKAKINELSGLISEEGAAHIIANELGIELINQNRDRLKIKEIYMGMKNVSALAKVVRKFEIREFAKGEVKGKVANLIIGDETGTLRLVLWNDQTKHFEKLNEEDIILIKDAYVKENNNNRELHLGDRGELVINPSGEKVERVRQGSAFERKTIGELKDGTDNVELLGTVVQVFDPRFFEVCPECAKRVNLSQCEIHGTVNPTLSYVLNLVFDDGTGTIRSVFWKNQTSHLLARSDEEMGKYKENPALFESVKTDLLGEQFKLMGRVKRNEMFDRLEFNVQLVEKANPAEEIKKLEK